jgi:hypothetical protein
MPVALIALLSGKQFLHLLILHAYLLQYIEQRPIGVQTPNRIAATLEALRDDDRAPLFGAFRSSSNPRSPPPMLGQPKYKNKAYLITNDLG